MWRNQQDQQQDGSMTMYSAYEDYDPDDDSATSGSDFFSRSDDEGEYKDSPTDTTDIEPRVPTKRRQRLRRVTGFSSSSEDDRGNRRAATEKKGNAYRGTTVPIAQNAFHYQSPPRMSAMAALSYHQGPNVMQQPPARTQFESDHLLESEHDGDADVEPSDLDPSSAQEEEYNRNKKKLGLPKNNTRFPVTPKSPMLLTRSRPLDYVFRCQAGSFPNRAVAEGRGHFGNCSPHGANKGSSSSTPVFDPSASISSIPSGSDSASPRPQVRRRTKQAAVVAAVPPPLVLFEREKHLTFQRSDLRMASVSVLRIGPSSDNISSKVVRNALLSYFQKPEANAGDESAETSVEESSRIIVISNKYFTAKVMLQDSEECTKMEHAKEDGIIMVFDALQSNPDLASSSQGRSGASFDSLALAHQQAEEKDRCGDLLRLCVGVSLSSMSPEELRGKDHEAEYSRRILFCLDRGYEYVEADMSKEGQAKGHSDRDKDGFARIVEAIQGTVWSSAIMSKKKQSELKGGYQATVASVGTAEAAVGEEESNPYLPPDPSSFGKQPMGTEEEIATKEEETVKGLMLEPEKVGPEKIQELRQHMESEQLFDQMEGVLREASRIREASKSGMLSDDERRQRAGDAALALVNLMDKFGLDEDEKFQEDSSDDDDSGILDD